VLLALFIAASLFACLLALHVLCLLLAHNRAQTSVANAASALGAAGGGPEPGRHEPCMMIRNGITGPSIKQIRQSPSQTMQHIFFLRIVYGYRERRGYQCG